MRQESLEFSCSNDGVYSYEQLFDGIEVFLSAVGDGIMHLNDEFKIMGHFFDYVFEYFGMGQAVVCRVDFHRIEMLLVIVEHFPRFYILGIKVPHPFFEGIS